MLTKQLRNLRLLIFLYPLAHLTVLYFLNINILSVVTLEGVNVDIFLLNSLVAVLLAPITEEIFFRGLATRNKLVQYSSLFSVTIFLALLITLGKDYLVTEVSEMIVRWFNFEYILWPVVATSISFHIILTALFGLVFGVLCGINKLSQLPTIRAPVLHLGSVVSIFTFVVIHQAEVFSFLPLSWLYLAFALAHTYFVKQRGLVLAVISHAMLNLSISVILIYLNWNKVWFDWIYVAVFITLICIYIYKVVYPKKSTS